MEPYLAEIDAKLQKLAEKFENDLKQLVDRLSAAETSIADISSRLASSEQQVVSAKQTLSQAAAKPSITSVNKNDAVDINKDFGNPNYQYSNHNDGIADHKKKAPTVDITPFDGHGDPLLFLSRFETAAYFSEFNNSQKVRAFIERLHGAAREWAIDQFPGGIASVHYDQLRKAFQVRFNTAAKMIEAQTELANLTIKNNESAENYIMRFEQLMRWVEGPISPENNQRYTFRLHQVLPPSFKIMFPINHQLQYEQLKQNVLSLDATIKAAQFNSNLVPFDQSRAKQVVCNYCTKFGHVEKDCFKKRDNRNKSGKKNEFSCKFCGKQGHKDSDCRIKNKASTSTSDKNSQASTVNVDYSNNMSNKLPKFYYTSVKLGCLTIKALIDTGAAVTAVSQHTFRLIQEKFPTLKIYKHKEKIYSCYGHMRSQFWCVTALLEIFGEKHIIKLLEVKNLNYDLVIGTNLLNKLKGSLQFDWKNGSFKYIPPDKNANAIPTMPDSTKSTDSDLANAMQTDNAFQTAKSSQSFNSCNTDAFNSELTCSFNANQQATTPPSKAVPRGAIATYKREENKDNNFCILNINSSVSDPMADLDCKIACTDPAQKMQIKELIEKYKHLFTKSWREIRTIKNTEHIIDTGRAQPVKSVPYRVPHKYRDFLKKEIDDMLAAGLIRESNSPWASSVFVVPKKDGTARVVIDYRKLNEKTKKDAYPMPRIDDALDKLHGAKFLTKMDTRSGYWQLLLSPESREKAAFCIPEGLYEPNVMTFGLANAPATFQRLMDRMFKDKIGKFMIVYIDDIFVYSTTFEQHLQHLEEVFKTLDEYCVSLATNKCTFAAKEIEFLGHVVTDKGIKPNQQLVQKHEKNYSATELECLAVVYGIKHFQHYLHGQKFFVISDHHALCYLKTMKNANARLMRWAWALQAFDYEVIYRSGKKHNDVDCISRYPSDDTNNSNCLKIVNFKEDDVIYSMTSEVHFDTLDELAQLQSEDEFCKNILRKLQQDRKIAFELKNNILHKRFIDDKGAEKLLIVVPRKCRKQILHDMHDSLTSGHLGTLKVREKILRRFWWPQLTQSVNRYVKGCFICQKRANPTAPFPGFLHPTEPIRPWHRISIDILGELTQTEKGNKWIILATAPYKPSTNGQVERLNATIANILAKYVNANCTDWDDLLPFVQFAINSAKQDTTRFSPYYILYGRHPLLISEIGFLQLSESVQSPVEYVNQLRETLQTTNSIVQENISARQEQNAVNYNKNKTEVSFKVGDKVLIKKDAIPIGTSKKLHNKWQQKAEIIEMLPNLLAAKVRIELTNLEKIVSVKNIKKFYETCDSTDNDPNSQKASSQVSQEIAVSNNGQSQSVENSFNHSAINADATPIQNSEQTEVNEASELDDSLSARLRRSTRDRRLPAHLNDYIVY
ncbi:reverse ribonuclease integrase-like protein [Dinothrombium tinctorium]|uniref:RNA-directed DNA polymerase n=2 Tax=Dinothrombium tinctorium TaxID=1965070 RepID=A0A443QIQ0_9ACAR|nr:reverse ribonuclease integrase-like protein [Dinothrombium tinctorium]